MKINHNIAAIKSNMKLQRTGNKMSASIERLSSGYRINKAADDAAGMAISQKMKRKNMNLVLKLVILVIMEEMKKLIIGNLVLEQDSNLK